MDLPEPDLGPPPRLRALPDHFVVIEDPREPHRVAYPLQEVQFLAVCGTIVDCHDDEAIASGGRSASIACAVSCRTITASRVGGGSRS